MPGTVPATISAYLLDARHDDAVELGEERPRLLERGPRLLRHVGEAVLRDAERAQLGHELGHARHRACDHLRVPSRRPTRRRRRARRGAATPPGARATAPPACW